MTLKDLPSFNAAEYAKQLRHHSTSELKQREIRKKRQQWSGFFPVTGGVLGAVHSFGDGLIIASQKLALIRAELQEREINLHKTEVKDIAIPLISFGVGAGIGFGLHEITDVVTNVDAPQCKWGFSSGAKSTLEAAISNPEDFIEGISSGVAEEISGFTSAVHNISDGIIPGSDLSEQILSSETTWNVAPSLEHAIGSKSGMTMAQVAEASMANHVASETAWYLMEACSPTADAKQESADASR